ncbi:MAG: ABC transporter ATP-binding protein [Candidatus Hecatellales archaeon B24]|nr:MAG: ABC transporter ATP-binding protein [Candidatus Hecatellales archaeon B24]
MEKVWKVYRGEGFRVEALRGVSFQVSEGEFCVVMGPSGSGKSTLLNLIGTIDTPTRGRIIIDGVDVTRLSEAEKDRFRNRRVGFIFQFFNLINELTVLENVMLPALICGVSFEEAEREALSLLRAVGLADKTSHSAAKLSGGEMQRVSIARALINKPALVLADEPTGNLDSQTSTEIIRLMKELNQRNRQTFILVTHDPTVAEAATKIVKILDGRVVEEKAV